MASASDFKVKKGLQVHGGDINLGEGQDALIQVDARTSGTGRNLVISAGEGSGSNAGGTISLKTAATSSVGNALVLAADKTATFSGAITAEGAVTFGSDGSGVDVTFHSGTSGDKMLWDASEEQLVITGTNGATALNVADGNVTISDTLTATNIGAFTASGAIDFGSQNMTNVDIDSGTIDGATIATSNITVGSSKTLDVSSGTLTTSAAQKLAIVQGVGANTDIGAYDFRAATLTADGLTSGRVVFTTTNGQLTDDSDMSFSGDTLTVTKLGAYEQAGAVDFSDEAMTNVNIDSGAIDGTIIGANSAAAGTFGALTGAAGTLTSLDVSGGNITNVGQISLDTIADDDSTGIIFKLDDDNAAGLDIQDGNASMMKFVTTNGSENVLISNPLVTIGDGTAEDTKLIFDGTEVDFRLGIDDGTDSLEIGPGAAHGTTAGLIIDGNGHVTQIGQSSAGANKYLKWDNSNSRAVWDTVSGTASSVAADDIDVGDSNIRIYGGSGDTVTLESNAAQLQILTTNSGELDITAVAALDINSVTSTHDASTSYTLTSPTVALTASTSMTLTSPVFKVTSSTSQRPVFTIEDTHADANGPTFTLSKAGGSQEDDDVVGNFTFDGQDDGDNTQTYGSIVTSVVDASAGAEKGKMVFKVAENDGTVTQGLAITGTGTDGIVDVTIGNGLQSTTTIAGNLTVTGATTTVSSTTLEVTDDLITVSKGNDTIANADGSGVEIDATGATNLYWKYVHSNTAWTSNVDIDTATTSDVYKIAGTSVLTNNTLGSGVVTSSLTTVGALNSGSITSGFGAINNGSSAITTTGLISGGSLDIDDVLINGSNIGHTDDTDLLTVADGSLTLAGTLNQESITLMDSYSATLTTTSATTMFTLASNTYSAGKVLASVWLDDGSDHRSVTEFLFTYQGASTPSASSNIHMTEYALVDTSGSQLATFDVVKDSGNILVQITPSSSTSTKVRAQITQFVI